MSIPPGIGYALGKLIGKIVGDVLITPEEIEGLMAGLLYIDAPPAGKTSLISWATEHASQLGRDYASELKRR